MLRGKAFSQALTEAIWSVPLIQTFEILRPALNKSQVDQIQNHLLCPITQTLTSAHDQLVFQQGRLESNYNAWLIAALGCLGLVLGEEKLIDRAIYGAGGFIAHLNAAVLPDGFEYEGTPYYHNFVTLAYTILAEFALRYGVDLYAIQGKNGQSIQSMWSALASLAFPDGSIPFIGDGSYWQNSVFDAELCEVYEVALARSGDPHYAWILDHAYARGCARRDSWAALLSARQEMASAAPPQMQPVALPDIGLAVLCDPIRPDGLAALLRYGPYAGEHTHFDCLSLLLYPFSQDSGNPPYGAESRRSWYRQSAAHNIVIVDGCSQEPTAGRLLSWTVDAGLCSAWAAADQAYSCVNFSRRVTLEAGRVSDRISLSAGEAHTFDWLLHTDVAPCFSEFQLTPAEGTLFPEGPGSSIRLISQGRCSGTLKTTFMQNGQLYRLTLSSPDPLAIFLARSPQRGGVNAGERFTLIGRQHSQQADFFAVYEKER